MSKFFRFTSLSFLLIVLFNQGQAQHLDSLLVEANRAYDQNNYILAQEKYLHLLHLADSLNQPAFIFNAQKRIAACYYYLRDNSTALKWFYTYLHTVKSNQADSLLSNAYYFITALYIEAEQVDSAEKYSTKAIDLMRKKNDFTHLSQTYSVLAELHLNTTKDPEKIESYISGAEKYADQSESKTMKAFAAMKRYNYYFRIKKDYKKALDYIRKAKDLYSETGDREAILNTYRATAECLIMLKDTSANHYINQWFLFKDSIFNADKSANMAKYEALYETRKKDAQLMYNRQLLKQEQQTTTLYVLILGVAFLLLISLFFIYRTRLQYKTQLLLKEQHEITVKEIFNAELKERIRIARDLHDSIGQKLSVMKMMASTLSHHPEIARISDSLSETANEVRAISHNLIPEILNLGLIKAIDSIADSINSTKTIRMNFSVSNESQKIKLPNQTELAVFRIIQEILNNIMKHANTSVINLDMSHTASLLQIIIEDNGIGFNTGRINQAVGLGWKNIMTRIQLINGTLKIKSEPDRGSKFIIEIPLP